MIDAWLYFMSQQQTTENLATVQIRGLGVRLLDYTADVLAVR